MQRAGRVKVKERHSLRGHGQTASLVLRGRGLECLSLSNVCTHTKHTQVVAFLNSCQHPDGGYGGGPGQMAHLAPTYAAVSALLTLGGEEALSSINRWAWDAQAVAWQLAKRLVATSVLVHVHVG